MFCSLAPLLAQQGSGAVTRSQVTPDSESSLMSLDVLSDDSWSASPCVSHYPAPDYLVVTGDILTMSGPRPMSRDPPPGCPQLPVSGRSPQSGSGHRAVKTCHMLLLTSKR